MKNYLTKQITALVIVLLCAPAFFSCNKGKSNQLDSALNRTIRIGFDGNLCQAAMAVAQHKGFFEAEGLKTELTRSGGGTMDNVRDALVGKKLDTTTSMIAGWLKPVTNGIDIRFTVGLHTGCTSAFVPANSNITGFKKGQTVAITGGFGGIYHNIANRFIAHDGFMPDDFTWKDFPADQILLVLQNKQSDVAVISDQLAERWVSDGTLRRIRSLNTDDDFKNEACCIMAIAGWFFDENPVTSEKISRAAYKASLWIDESDENKRETAQILFDNGYISGNIDYAFQLLKLWRFGLSNDITEKSIYDSVNEYQALGVIDKNIDPESFKKQIWQSLNIEEK